MSNLKTNLGNYQIVLPWELPDLKSLDIVCINHYHVDGKRMIYVALSKNGKLIKEEGEDNQEIWRALRTKAMLR